MDGLDRLPAAVAVELDLHGAADRRDPPCLRVLPVVGRHHEREAVGGERRLRRAVAEVHAGEVVLVVGRRLIAHQVPHRGARALVPEDVEALLQPLGLGRRRYRGRIRRVGVVAELGDPERLGLVRQQRARLDSGLDDLVSRREIGCRGVELRDRVCGRRRTSRRGRPRCTSKCAGPPAHLRRLSSALRQSRFSRNVTGCVRCSPVNGASP